MGVTAPRDAPRRNGSVGVFWAASRTSRGDVVEVGVVRVSREVPLGRGFVALGVAGEVSAAFGRRAVIGSSSVAGVGGRGRWSGVGVPGHGVVGVVS